jgi:hypothetical protein
MWTDLIICLTQVSILLLCILFSRDYIRLKKLVFIALRKMNVDTIVDQMLAEKAGDSSATVPASAVSTTSCQVSGAELSSGDCVKRERLAALAAGGQAKLYLGRALTPEHIDAMTEDEIAKLYTRYEMRLGAEMTQTLGKSALQLYVAIANRYLPIDDLNSLQADLEKDPFARHALSAASCQVYHKYGMYLAPITVGLTTLRHCHFGHVCPRTDNTPESLTRQHGGAECTGNPAGGADAPGVESD